MTITLQFIDTEVEADLLCFLRACRNTIAQCVKSFVMKWEWEFRVQWDL